MEPLSPVGELICLQWSKAEKYRRRCSGEGLAKVWSSRRGLKDGDRAVSWVGPLDEEDAGGFEVETIVEFCAEVDVVPSEGGRLGGVPVCEHG